MKSNKVLFVLMLAVILTIALSVFSSAENLKQERYIVELYNSPLIEKTNKIKAQSFGWLAPAIKLNKADILEKTKNRILEEQYNAKKKIISTLEQAETPAQKSTKSRIQTELTNVFNGFIMSMSSSEAEKIKNLPEVKNVYKDQEMHLLLDKAVPYVKGYQAQALGFTGKGIKVAILDSGIDKSHPDFQGRVAKEFDFANTVLPNIIDTDASDDDGHGTEVAGVLAGNGAASNGKYKGIAYEAELYIAKVIDSNGKGYSGDFVKAIDWAVDPDSNPLTKDGAEVISISTGSSENCYDSNDFFSPAVDRAVQNGVVVVIGAGNSGPKEWSMLHPGCAKDAVTVGSVKQLNSPDDVSQFSSRGPANYGAVKPDVMAPGEDITTSRWSGSSSPIAGSNYYTSATGTSVATPFVSGAAVLLKQAHPDWNAYEIKSAIMRSARNLGMNVNSYGHGVLDIENALKIQNPPSIVYLDFPGNITQNSVDLFGYAYGRNYRAYSILIFDRNKNDWVKVAESNAIVPTTAKLGSFDSSQIPKGQTIIKITADNLDGTQDISYTNINIQNPNSPDYIAPQPTPTPTPSPSPTPTLSPTPPPQTVFSTGNFQGYPTIELNLGAVKQLKEISGTTCFKHKRTGRLYKFVFYAKTGSNVVYTQELGTFGGITRGKIKCNSIQIALPAGINADKAVFEGRWVKGTPNPVSTMFEVKTN